MNNLPIDNSLFITPYFTRIFDPCDALIGHWMAEGYDIDTRHPAKCGHLGDCEDIEAKACGITETCDYNTLTRTPFEVYTDGEWKPVCIWGALVSYAPSQSLSLDAPNAPEPPDVIYRTMVLTGEKEGEGTDKHYLLAVLKADEDKTLECRIARNGEHISLTEAMAYIDDYKEKHPNPTERYLGWVMAFRSHPLPHTLTPLPPNGDSPAIRLTFDTLKLRENECDIGSKVIGYAAVDITRGNEHTLTCTPQCIDDSGNARNIEPWEGGANAIALGHIRQHCIDATHELEAELDRVIEITPDDDAR